MRGSATDENPNKSKTKCLIFGDIAGAAPLSLYNRDIPYVNEAVHLGHVINTDESMCHDVIKKTNDLRGGFFTILQEMGEQSPSEYTCCIYMDVHSGTSLMKGPVDYGQHGMACLNSSSSCHMRLTATL